MEKKHLLLISGNDGFITSLEAKAGTSLGLITAKNMHVGYTMALGYLPDVILIDFTSLSAGSTKNIQNFKSTHFLKKSHLFLYVKAHRKKELQINFKEHFDRIFTSDQSISSLWEEIERSLSYSPSLTNYWKDSFMGLFHLLKQPVVLLQNEKVVAMNDSFKKFFFVTNPALLKITDFIESKNKYEMQETLRKFARGKHMKATTEASLILMKKKKRKARVTFSKLDKGLNGQMVMMINFEEKELPMNSAIGTASRETEEYFSKNHSRNDYGFTRREKEVIDLLCKGYKTREISESLSISAKTIEKHRASIIRRTNSDTILESVVYALNNKLIEL